MNHRPTDEIMSRPGTPNASEKQDSSPIQLTSLEIEKKTIIKLVLRGEKWNQLQLIISSYWHADKWQLTWPEKWRDNGGDEAAEVDGGVEHCKEGRQINLLLGQLHQKERDGFFVRCYCLDPDPVPIFNFLWIWHRLRFRFQTPDHWSRNWSQSSKVLLKLFIEK